MAADADLLYGFDVHRHLFADRLRARLLEITGDERLLASTPALLERLSHRNPWVDPLNHLQVELLERVRAGADADRAALLATITGIAAGMRNTG